jgi:leucyl aminopeptidase (aminopeptidase T)
LNTIRSIASASAVLGLAILAGAVPLARPGPDNKALASTLVSQCAAVREGDIVLIRGGVRNQELLENIAADVSKLGGYPLLTFGSDRLDRLLYDQTPAKYDTRTPELGLKIANLIHAEITIDYNETPTLFSDVPAERMAAISKTRSAVAETVLRRNVRQVFLGNGLYPTDATAAQFGITKDQLAQIFWAGVNTDYANLQSAGERLKTTLAAGKELTITNPNGTNLTVKIQGRPAFVSDGVISANDAQKGGPACQAWLPAGEVYFAPAPGTAEGKVVIDRLTYRGKTVEGLTLTFKAGKLTAMTATSGLEPIKALYDASDTGKDVFAFIDLGINPDVQIPPGSHVLAWMPAGMTTIGLGNNTWAGGDNKTSFELAGHIPGSTVKVDGTTVVESGTLRP